MSSIHREVDADAPDVVHVNPDPRKTSKDTTPSEDEIAFTDAKQDDGDEDDVVVGMPVSTSGSDSSNYSRKHEDEEEAADTVTIPAQCPFKHGDSSSTTTGPNTPKTPPSLQSLGKFRRRRSSPPQGNNNICLPGSSKHSTISASNAAAAAAVSGAGSASGSCPMLTGASQSNAKLLGSLGSASGILQIVAADDDLHEEEEEHSQTDPKVVVKYSWTMQNKEFPYEIQEQDLFNQATNDSNNDNSNNTSADGYLTRKHGFFIPNYDEALDALCQSRGRIWVALGKRMNGLMTNNNGLIKAVDELEIVQGDEKACPVQSLQIASSILAQLTNGYRAACWRNNMSYEPAPALAIPWKRICQRLGRKDEYVAVEDFIYNCRPVRGGTLYDIDNLQVMTPIWNSAAELIMFKLLCASNHSFQNMLPGILALARGEWQARHIYTLIREISGMTKMMGKAIPDGAAGENAIDPVEFATAFSNATAPLKEGVPALTGAGCPIFFILDLIIGRQSWTSITGKDLLMQVEFMPKNWRRFIEFLRQKRLFEHVPPELEYLWELLKDSYSGERGWLGRHKYRAYQFIELSSALGGATNKGVSGGAGVIHELEISRQERAPGFCSDRSSYKMCLFKGRICSVKRVSEDRLCQLVTIESSKPLFFHLGDHVAIVMVNDDDTIWTFSVRYNLNLRTVLSLEEGTLSEAWKERLNFEQLEYTVYNVLMCAKLAPGRKNSSVALTHANMCEMLFPEEPRLYSFATINPEQDKPVTKFDLLVTKTGNGGCSAFLFNSVGKEVSFGLSTSSKLGVPSDTTRPVVVIAAGSGLGTYLPMLLNDEIQNPKYAFLAFRTERTVPCLESHLRDAVAYNKLKLFIELSREEDTLVTNNRSLRSRKTSKRYLDKLMRDQGALLQELAAPIEDGGMEANFYVCGNNGFFSTVRDSLEQIESGMVASLVKGNRLHLEVQARGGTDGKTISEPISLAEMCFHNKASDSWCAIHGKVYDFSSYLPWHPGGRKILHYIAGTDCTEQWNLASHDKDRMVYSQLPAYEIGPFQSDRSELNMFLEFITRTENCLLLYEEEDDLFDNLCDSYSKVQKMLENIFGPDFLDLALRLLDPEPRSRVMHRVWFALHSRERKISNRLFRVAPMKRSKEHQKSVLGASSKEMLRSANMEERSQLKNRLVRASGAFFLWCKQAVADLVLLGTKRNRNHCSRMFYRLVMAIEHFYSSLAKPLPLESARKWAVVRSELIVRRTLLLRFPTEVEDTDDEFAELLESDPTNEDEIAAFKERMLEHWQVDNTLGSRFDKGKSTNLINDWFEHEHLQGLFQRLDVDDDGLVARKDLERIRPELDDREQGILDNFEKSLANKECNTYTFADFLESVPEVAQRNSTHRVSSLMFKGIRP